MGEGLAVARAGAAGERLATVGRVSLVVAGLAFVAYPLLRPWADVTGGDADSAGAFASNTWVAAHLMGVVGFALLPLGVLALWWRSLGRGGGAAEAAVTATVLGVGGVLPYYGAEAFGLHALGREALRRGEPALAGLAGQVRFGPGVWAFGIGLLMLALAGVFVAVAASGAGPTARWGGLLLGAGLVLYLPQFYGGAGLRVAHGALVGVGCVLLATGLARRPPRDGTVSA